MTISRMGSSLSRGLRDRRWWTVPLVWLVSFGLLLGVLAVAGRLSGTLVLGSLPGVGALDYSRDTFGSVAPLERAFVLDSLGAPFFDRLRQEVGPGPVAPGSAPRESPEGGNRGPDTPRKPGEIPSPEELAAGPDLRVRMAVDKVSASRGDTLEYVITVTNVGEGTVKRLEIRSHVPAQTSLVSTPQCGGENVRVSPGEGPGGLPATCVDVPVGATAPGEHEIVIGVEGLNPGRTERFRFRVAINPDAPEGHHIRNHAHVRADQTPEHTSNEVTTVVS